MYSNVGRNDRADWKMIYLYQIIMFFYFETKKVIKPLQDKVSICYTLIFCYFVSRGNVSAAVLDLFTFNPLEDLLVI